MNREIKFRGKRVDNGNWVYGSFIHNSIYCLCIIRDDSEQYEVIPESVCQFTGLKDKNGIDIYEGDMVVAWSQGSKGTFQIKWRHTGNPCWLLYPNFLNREHWSISSTEHKKGKKFINIDGSITLSQTDGYYDKGLEVIGNIHENKK